MKKKLFFITFTIVLIFSLLSACANETKVDFTNEADFESALNAGDDLTGKVVTITVDTLVPNSVCGYNIQTGDHLNFCSTNNPGVKEGDSITVKVTEISSMIGSYLIQYEQIK